MADESARHLHITRDLRLEALGIRKLLDKAQAADQAEIELGAEQVEVVVSDDVGLDGAV